MKYLIVVLMLFTVVLAQQARYDNYKLYSLTPRTEEQMQMLKDLKNSGLPFEFWADPHVLNFPVPIMVPPHKTVEFEDILPRMNMEWALRFDNVQRYIDECNPRPSPKAQPYDFTVYYDLEEINQWMEYISRRFSQHTRLITVGRSYEGRDIRGIKVSFREGNKAVFIEGGIHAREWIGPSTVTYILNEVLNSSNVDVRAMAESYDWYFVPSVNPDGYEYSYRWDRLWRKTRSIYGLCTGADLNRNWDNNWNENGTEGPCFIHYPGDHPFSEPEAQSFSEYISTVANDLVAYFAMHSYGQLFLIPFGNGTHANNFDEQYAVGKKVVESIEAIHGTNYIIGNWGDILYPSSGVSVDWVKDNHNVPFTYTIELRDRGQRGFLLPSDQIIPVGKEILDGLITFVREIKARGY